MSIYLERIADSYAKVIVVGLFCLIFCSGAYAQGTSCAPMPAGTVSWWAGDGNALDNFGTYHATRQNGAGFGSGKVGQGFTFNGSSQYVSIPQSANLPVRGTNSFTIEAWVNHQGNDSPSIFNLFSYRNGGDDVQFIVTRTEVVVWATTAVGIVLRIPHGVNPAAWNHYAITRSGNVWRVYVNGVQVGSDVSNGVNMLSPSTTQNIGTNGAANTQFAIGSIDEIGIFGRALSQSEIQSIYNAGSAGRCRACIGMPAGQISLWEGENHPLDTSLVNNGTVQNGATFGNGKVGQAFSFSGSNQFVEIPDSPSLRPTSGVTLEGWFKFNSPGGSLISKPHAGTSNAYVMWTESNSLNAGITGGTVSALFSPTAGEWYHLAYTYDEATSQHRLLVNGEVVASTIFNSDFIHDSNPLLIGIDKDLGSPVLPLNGMADEAAVHDRALTVEEIRSIVFAGYAGRCRQCASPPVGMVGWWPADGNGYDVRGGNNASLVNNATYAGGLVGNAFSLDGADSYALVGEPVPAALQIQNEITLDAWIYLTGYPPSNSLGLIVGSQYDTTGSGASIFIDGRTDTDGQIAPPGHIHFQIGDGSWHASNTRTSVPLNQWVHIAATRKAGEDAKIYFNGVSQPLTSNPWSGSITYNGSWFAIGQQKDIYRPFTGLIDEVEIFGRALTEREIRTIVIAGSSGKCKPTSLRAPNGLFAWWSGDGNSSDLSGNGMHATLVGGNYTVGKVGQAFRLDGVDDHLNGGVIGLAGNSFTIEMWARRSALGPPSLLVGQGAAAIGQGLHIGWRNNTTFTFDFFNDWINVPDTADQNWHHWAFTFDSSTRVKRIFKDGVRVSTDSSGGQFSGGGALWIGRSPWGNGDWPDGAPFAGSIDEPSVYLNRVLSESEIASIYNAGLAGKLKTAGTPAGLSRSGRSRAWPLMPSAVNVSVGDATVSFPSVSVAGLTQEIPLDTQALPALPAPYSHTGLAYDISTSATFSGSPSVCFNLPAFGTGEFPDLRILHLELGSWADRTTLPASLPNLCATGATTLSPWVIATLSPTAASVVIGGTVADATGNPLSGIRVTLTDMDGNERSVVTGSFGAFSFEDVSSGGNYIIRVFGAKREFADPVRVLYVTDDMTDLRFVTVEPAELSDDR